IAIEMGSAQQMQFGMPQQPGRAARGAAKVIAAHGIEAISAKTRIRHLPLHPFILAHDSRKLMGSLWMPSSRRCAPVLNEVHCMRDEGNEGGRFREVLLPPG